MEEDERGGKRARKKLIEERDAQLTESAGGVVIDMDPSDKTGVNVRGRSTYSDMDPSDTTGVNVRGRSSSSCSGSEHSGINPIAAEDFLVPQRKQVERLLLEASVVDALVNAVMSLSEDPVLFLKQADSVREMTRALNKANTARLISYALCRSARRVRARQARQAADDSKSAGRVSSSKFQGLRLAAYGGTSDFHEGIDALGMPRAEIFKGMEDDMLRSADSRDRFQTSNYGGTWSTPSLEWQFVVSPNMHEIYPGFRKPVQIEIFYYAVCAIRSKRIATRLFPSMVSWAPFNTALSCCTIRIEHVRAVDGKYSKTLNGTFNRSQQVVNGLPVYVSKNNSNTCMWWCGGKDPAGLTCVYICTFLLVKQAN
jgi:hypothetical protein